MQFPEDLEDSPLNFKFFGIFFFEMWRSEKRIALSEKKPPLASYKKYFYYLAPIFTIFLKSIEQLIQRKVSCLIKIKMLMRLPAALLSLKTKNHLD